MFSFEQLNAFVAVAHELHFGRAAVRLNMTQPPLSRQIQALERQLQVQLFDRSTRSVRLTDAGQAFLVEAERILSLADTAADNARRASAGLAGIVHIGFTSVVGHAHLPRLLQVAASCLPDVELKLHEMVTADQLAGLMSGTVDLGLGRPPLGESAMSYRALPDEFLTLAVNEESDLAGRSEVPLAELHQRDFLMYTAEGSRYFHDHLTGVFHAHSVAPVYVQQVTQVHTMIGLVDAGLGAALVPDSTRNWASDRVRFARVPELAAHPTTSNMVWRSDSGNPALRSLLAALDA